MVADAAPPAGLLRHAYEALKHVQRSAPEEVARVLGHPTVDAWVVSSASKLAEGEPVAAEDLACVAIAAAIRGRVPVSFPVPPMHRIPLPTLGTVFGSISGVVDVRIDAGGGVELGHGAGMPADLLTETAGWRPVPRIAVITHGFGATFLLEPWVPTESSALRQAERVEVAAWQERIASAWELLVTHHPIVAEELAVAVTMLSPLRAASAGMSSATATDAFGCLFMSLAPDAETAGVTLTHELQHTKLVALMDLFPLAETVPGELFYAPWRDDPRPIVGLLHGTYAFTGVAEYWRRLRSAGGPREHQAQVEFARWREATQSAIEILLDSGRLTTPGEVFVSGMAELVAGWHAEPVPASAAREARRLASDHRTKWMSTVGLESPDVLNLTAATGGSAEPIGPPTQEQAPPLPVAIDSDVE